MTLDTLNNIIIMAFKSATDPDYEAFYRGVCRWYSREFSTPLVQVEQMAEENVLLTYYEDIYSKIVEDTSDKGIEKLNGLREYVLNLNNRDLDLVKDNEDEAWIQEMNDDVAKDEKIEKPQEIPNIIENEQNYILGGEDSIPPEDDSE